LVSSPSSFAFGQPFEPCREVPTEARQEVGGSSHNFEARYAHPEVCGFRQLVKSSILNYVFDNMMVFDAREKKFQDSCMFNKSMSQQKNIPVLPPFIVV